MVFQNFPRKAWSLSCIPPHTHTFYSFKYFSSVLKLENISFDSFYQNLHLKSQLRNRCCLFLAWRLGVGILFLFPVRHPLLWYRPSTSGAPCLTLVSAQSSASHLATVPPWTGSMWSPNLPSYFVRVLSHPHELLYSLLAMDSCCLSPVS